MRKQIYPKLSVCSISLLTVVNLSSNFFLSLWCNKRQYKILLLWSSLFRTCALIVPYFRIDCAIFQTTLLVKTENFTMAASLLTPGCPTLTIHNFTTGGASSTVTETNTNTCKNTNTNTNTYKIQIQMHIKYKYK